MTIGTQAHGHKQILVIDNDNARAHQMATVLSFVGEHFVQCSQEQVNEFFKQSDHLLTVVLSGDILPSTANLVKANPTIPFILHDVLDANALSLNVNVIGNLSLPLNYAQLTELIHHCHQPKARREWKPDLENRSTPDVDFLESSRFH